MKKINLKISKERKILIMVMAITLLAISLTLFVKHINVQNKLTNSEKAVDNLLNIFYTEKYDKEVAEVLLDKPYDEYFNELKQDLYSRVYNSIKDLGDGKIVENEDAVTIANNYSSESVSLLKRVKSYKITKTIETSDGYLYTIVVLPENLAYIYDVKNTCISKKMKEVKEEIYRTAINYYCSTEGMKQSTDEKGAEVVVNIEMKKNQKGYYIPTKESLNTLLSVVL